MRSYWLRILLGALAVFAIGMIGVTLSGGPGQGHRSGDRHGSARRSRCPFVPFELDGNKLGMVERLVVNRDAPKKVSSVDLQVKLDDSLMVQGLAGCRLAANLESDSSKAGDINVHAHRMDETGVLLLRQERLGLVRVRHGDASQPGDVTVPLLVPASLADTLQNGNWGDQTTPTRPMSWPSGPNRWPTPPRTWPTPSHGGAAATGRREQARAIEFAAGRLAPRRGQAACGFGAVGRSARMADSLHAR